MIELLFLAGVAIFVVTRLIGVMGQKRGAPPPSADNKGNTARLHRVGPANESLGDEDAPDRDLGAPVDGLDEIRRADEGFSRHAFVSGAKQAYEMIVTAFAEGDRSALKPLLTPEVYDAYIAAIDAREADGTPPLEFVRLKQASVENGELDGSVASIDVMFEAELSEGERIRQTREEWTFERDLKARDPNWRLSGVTPAS